MTVIHYIIPRLGTGGAERTLVNLVNNLPESYKITIWTLLPPGELAGEVANRIDVKSVHASGKHDLRAAYQLIERIRSADPDIVQSFLFFDNVLARLLGIGRNDITVICGVRVVPEDPSKLRVKIDQATVKLADHIVSNSKAGSDMIIDQGAAPSKVSVIHNGRHIESYRNATPPPKLNDTFGISSDSILLGHVGRLIERKGQYDLLSAFRDVHKSHPDTELLLVGDGPEYDGLERRAVELGLEDVVHLAGLRDDVPQLLQAMDLFVFPSHFEGLPGALIEAMAAELPIVATEIPGNDELVTHKETGLLVPAKAPSELGEAIRTLLDDSDRSDMLSSNAATVAEEKFSVEKMVSRFDSLYNQLL